MMFGDEIEAAIIAHARAAYPEEACGLVTDEGFVAVQNVAADPLRQFEMPPDALLNRNVRAVVHTHPDGVPWPSAHDMKQQIATGLTWGVVVVTADQCYRPLWWGPDVPIPPLLGRDFRPGPSGSDGRGDCYALIRDWYQVVRGVTLPEYPRDDEWWEAGGNLYAENFTHAGFVRIDLDEVQYGDVVLAAINARVTNHGGIVLRDGLVLHHLRHRLSREEPLGRWERFITHALRYVGDAH